ncbi:MAG: DUF2442 domain-containing protein [Pirellulaceae bacterium]|jgi:hypothetical protein
MILNILDAKLAGPNALDVTFNDGSRFVVDLRPLLTGAMFEPLLDPAVFAQFSLDPVCRTIVWPNGADLAPEAIRDLALAEQSIGR